MKQIHSIHRSPAGHWVGDGFPVRSLFTYDRLGQALSPFLLLDYAGPYDFTPTATRRGVGQHPHRGFETVTLVYHGEVEHRDSTGAGGAIGPGDVQWMTAGDGILHEEFHSPAFAREGGYLEMVQLWVNLPARHKNAAAGYQSLSAASIPNVELPNGAGRLRVIAGAYGDARGPARTHTPMEVWDLNLAAGASLTLPLAAGHTAALVVLQGRLQVNDASEAGPASLVVLEREGQGVQIRTLEPVKMVLLSGEPIDEPIVGHGPFVMNTREEILESFEAFQTGRFGTLGGVETSS